MGLSKREMLLAVAGCVLVLLFLIIIQTPQLSEKPPVQESGAYPAIYLNVCMDGEIVRMELERYITGVVLAEMPADFEMEALKAQAIVARTFACKSMTEGKHTGYSVCTSPSCCQGYRSVDAYLKSTGNPEALNKIRQAVVESSGLVITYDGQLIEATYFSCSGGWTEDAQAVWGSSYPYLTAKESPGEEGAFCFTDTKVVSVNALMDVLNLSLTGTPSAWFQDWIYTDGGGVASVNIGGKSFSGTELRKRLDLRSTAFSVEATEAAVAFHTRGFGHRVGMSQYGADAMAVRGNCCEEIIFYYYNGAEIANLFEILH